MIMVMYQIHIKNNTHQHQYQQLIVESVEIQDLQINQIKMDIININKNHIQHIIHDINLCNCHK